MRFHAPRLAQDQYLRAPLSEAPKSLFAKLPLEALLDRVHSGRGLYLYARQQQTTASCAEQEPHAGCLMAANIRSATASHENCALTSFAAWAVNFSTAGLSRTEVMAEASSVGSSLPTSAPFFPGLMISGIAKAERPITGIPFANASKKTIPKASKREGITKR